MRAALLVFLLPRTIAPAGAEEFRPVTLGLSAWLTQPIVQSA